MSNTEWQSIDIKIFTNCIAQMQHDEIISNNEFNANIAMKSNTFGSHRSDSHVIANGIYSINDFISKGNYLPDENITHDEIRQIQGKLLDIMMARFEGNNIFQTVLTCIYVHKEYAIKNSLLRTVIYSFVNLIFTVEDFIDKYKRISSSSMWLNDDKHLGISYLHDKSNLDPFSIRKDLERFKSKDPSISDIVNFSLFMLDFSEFLLDFQNKKSLNEPEEISKESAKFGCSYVLHNRQLSTSIPPFLIQIKKHDESVQQFIEMIKIINEFQNIQKPSSILDLFIFLYEWNVSNPKVIILVRIILGAILLPDPCEESFCIYGWPSFKDLLISDLNKFHITDSIFNTDEIITVYEFVTYSIQSLLMPLCLVHSTLQNRILQYWDMVCSFLIDSSRFMNFPKTDSESTNQIVENPIINYFHRISLEILNIYLKLGFKCGIYNVRDYEQIFFSILHKSLKKIYYENRLVSTVYDSFKITKLISNDEILKKIGEESNEEIVELILVEYFEYCVYYMQFILKTNCIDSQSNDFYNQKQVFEARRLPLTKISSTQFIEFNNFHCLYDPKCHTIDQIQTQIKKKSDDAKKSIKKLKLRQNLPKMIDDILKRIVTSSLMLSQWKEGDIFKVSLDNDCIPSFQIIQS